MAGRRIGLALMSVAFLIGTFLLHGLVGMGDCYREEPIYSRCLADQARVGRGILIGAALLYVLLAWLLVRRRTRG